MTPQRCFALALALSVACGEDERPPALAGSGGPGPGAHPGAGAGAGAAGQGGDGAPAGGADGEGGDAGGSAGEDAGGGIGNVGQVGGFAGEWGFAGAPVLVAPQCDPDATFSQRAELGELSTTPGDERLLAVTPDELTLLFARQDELLVADRAAPADDFAPELAIAVPAGFDVSRGAALAPDGLRVVLVAADGKSFGELTRGERGDAFEPDVDVAPFSAINTAAVHTGSSLAAPALAASDEALYFTGDAGYSRVHVSRREEGGWGAGNVIDPYTLSGTHQDAKLVTGVAPDELTIFVFDQAVGHVVAYWRDTPSSPFYTPAPLEGLTAAQAAGGCSRLYASAHGSQSLDLFTLEP